MKRTLPILRYGVGYIIGYAIVMFLMFDPRDGDPLSIFIYAFVSWLPEILAYYLLVWWVAKKLRLKQELVPFAVEGFAAGLLPLYLVFRPTSLSQLSSSVLVQFV
jgi:hypothetical protein